MADVLIPRANSPLIEKWGAPTSEWYQYWEVTGRVAVDLSALQTQVTELQAEVDGLPTTSFTITGMQSVQVIGQPAAGNVTLQLINDSTAPGNLFVYGTDSAGAKVWRSLASTTDLAEGTNLYFTVARVRATTLTGLSVATNSPVLATDTVLAGVGKLQAQLNAIPTMGGSTFIMAARTTAQNFSANAFTTIIYNSESFDSLGEYNTSTGEFVPLNAGIYVINASVHAGPVSDGTNYAISIFRNGTEASRLSEQLPSNPTAGGVSGCNSGSTMLNLIASDVITVKVYVGATPDPSNLKVTGSFAAGTHLEIRRIF